MTQASPTLETALMVIDGKDVEAAGGGWCETRDPATGRVLARIPKAGAADVDTAVRAAREAQPAWEGLGAFERGRLLLAIAERIAAQVEELTRLETLDVGKPLHEARVDVHHAERLFRFYGEAADKLPTEKLTVEGGIAFTDRIAHGVTGHITPWNYPIQLFARTVAPALAAGNACVVKPAEDTPLTSLAAARLALEAGLPPGVLNVVTGLGAEAGGALADHPDVDHLSFTGSRATGERVMVASARQMRPVMLELGGKSPSILLSDVDVAELVPTLRSAVLWNAGQTCDAQSRILVDRAIHADVVDALAADFAQVKIGPGVEDHDLGPLVSEIQHGRVSAHVGAARPARGSSSAAGAPADSTTDGSSSRRSSTSPTLRRRSPTTRCSDPCSRSCPSATNARPSAWQTVSGTTLPPPSGPRTSTAASDSRARSGPARSTSTAGGSALASSSRSAGSARADSAARRACARSTNTPRSRRRPSAWTPARRNVDTATLGESLSKQGA
jgi:aldehyde dehydrogenase (NAD+)